MLRLAVVVCLMIPSAAFAGENRRSFQVGITITGKVNSMPGGKSAGNSKTPSTQRPALLRPNMSSGR